MATFFAAGTGRHKGRRVASEPASNEARSTAHCSARGREQSLMRVSAATSQCSRAARPASSRPAQRRASPFGLAGNASYRERFLRGRVPSAGRAGDEPGIAQLGRLGQPLLSWRRVIVQGVYPVVINNASLLSIPLSNAKCAMRLSGAQLQ